jgi:hypothetical protein
MSLVAGGEAEGVLQAPLDDLVGHADVHDVRQVVLGRRLGGGQADGAGIRADDGAHARLVHLLDFGRARGRRGLGVAQQGFELGAAQGLDAAGLVDVFQRHHRALAALLAGVGERAGHRMQHAHLDGAGLGPAHQRKGEGGGRGARVGDEAAAVQGSVAHGRSPSGFSGTARTSRG